MALICCICKLTIRKDQAHGLIEFPDDAYLNAEWKKIFKIPFSWNMSRSYVCTRHFGGKNLKAKNPESSDLRERFELFDKKLPEFKDPTIGQIERRQQLIVVEYIFERSALADNPNPPLWRMDGGPKLIQYLPEGGNIYRQTSHSIRDTKVNDRGKYLPVMVQPKDYEDNSVVHLAEALSELRRISNSQNENVPTIDQLDVD